MKRTRQSEHIVLVDGLYMVQSAYFCAGFEVENGKVTQCAPILRKRLIRNVTNDYKSNKSYHFGKKRARLEHFAQLNSPPVQDFVRNQGVRPHSWRPKSPTLHNFSRICSSHRLHRDRYKYHMLNSDIASQHLSRV